METRLNPYLNFKSNALQAMEFYKSVFGGELKMSTFKEYHASQSPAEDNLIMHAELNAGEGLTFMGSDTPARMEFRPGTNISMSLSGENEDELKTYFNKLSAGGTISMPLEKAIWGDTFGMCTDKFGIGWLVNITAPKAEQSQGMQTSMSGH
jgi:PhnB protein